MSQTQVERLFIADKTSLMADVFRLTSTFTNSAASETFVTSNITQSNAAGFGALGTGMSQSSGVFSFPATGIYQISFHIMAYAADNTDSRYVGAAIEGTTNNSSYTKASLAYDSITETRGDNTYGYVAVDTIFDCTDTSTHKVKFRAISDQAISVAGASDKNYTYMTFTRLGDT